MEDNGKDKEAGFGSRFFSGLKDIILEDEAPPRGKTSYESVPSAGPSAATSATPQPTMVTSQASNLPMAKNLMELVLNRATAYTALTEAMEPLEDIIPDEMTRYRAAFAVIKKNRTLEQLTQAIDLQHLQALEAEVARFGIQAKEKEATDIDARINESQTLKTNIEAAKAQAVKLRQEIDARIRTIEESVRHDTQRVEEINREIAEKSRAIASVQRQFDTAAAAVRDSLLQSKEKILKYLST